MGCSIYTWAAINNSGSTAQVNYVCGKHYKNRDKCWNKELFNTYFTHFFKYSAALSSIIITVQSACEFLLYKHT